MLERKRDRDAISNDSCIFCTLTNGEFEGAILKGCICRPENDCIPLHNVVVTGSATDSSGRILLKDRKRIKTSKERSVKASITYL